MPSRVAHDDSSDVLGFHDDLPRKHSHNVFVNQAFTVSDACNNTNNGGPLENGSAGAHFTGKSKYDNSTYDETDEIKKDTHSREDKPEKEDEFKSLLPFCVVFGLGSLFSQSIQTYLSSQITVIEKVFGLSSSKSGFLLSANDVGFVSAVLFASHFLKNKHIPRVLGSCLLLFGVSGICTSLPQFISWQKNGVTSSHNASQKAAGDFLCVPGSANIFNKTTSECSKHAQSDGGSGDDSVQWILILIASMMIVQGAAKAPRQPLSNTYIDSNSAKTNTGFYLSVLISFTIFGPFLALTLGGVFNKIPVDLKETSLTAEDPRWIGAWWLGFIVFGVCTLLTAVPVFFFSASLKKRPETQDTRSSEYMNAGHVAEKEKSKTFLQLATGMPRSVMRILSKPIYVTHVIGTLLNIMAIYALGSFGPKYVENQFMIPTWKANIIQGIEKLASTSIGTLAGGIVTKRFQLDMRGCIKMVILTRIIGLLLHTLNFVFGCDNPQIIGYDIPSRVATNMSCLCSDSNYLPVCADGDTYFSPCYAGCTTELDGVYSDCSASVSGVVNSGMCDTGCNYLIPFVVFNAVNSLIQTAGISPSFVIMLRSVKAKDRSMAIGLHSFLLSLLVLLPSPLLFGAIFDSICLVWKTSSSCSGSDGHAGKIGACSLYDVRGMRLKFISIDCGLKAVSIIMAFVTFYLLRKQFSREEQTTKEIVISKPPVPQPRISIGGQEQQEIRL